MTPEVGHKTRRLTFIIAGTIGLVVAAMASYADFNWANSVKAEAIRLATEYSQEGRAAFFEGHWGFQYYMMQYGATPLNSRQTSIPLDCVVIAPLNNTNFDFEAFSGWRLIEDKQEPHEWKVRLTDFSAAAGFYSNLIGPLPLSFSPHGRDRYVVLVPPE